MDFIFDDKLPIYTQIINYIKKKIILGEICGGDKLPSVRDLSSELKVNPNTIQRSYQELEREGLTYTQRGTGTFVTENKDAIFTLKKDMAKEVIDRFLREMKDLGFKGKDIINIVSEETNKGEE
ncbi:GntR family transcriptional regulator [Clostridium sp. MSJ-4]|uniref:GntR family transcriptional regulator n=1 Tax=Clostridium simiarum TaxID=2841506 RepID=A0ABS6F0N1_9CLOT|nr:GntR family transcriptional regulator [Clostridium simiarum]MBU5591173.1 GntR family transcriptional regulator [Clostridium simiarum]